jgi:mono/diheme cytochrome c family protein
MSRFIAIFATVALAISLMPAQDKKAGGKAKAPQNDSKASAAGDVAKGKAVFEQCSICHNADSTEKKMGPGLKGLFKMDKMTNGKKPTEENVRTKIDDGSTKDGGSGMPAYKEMLTDSEKDDLIAYLKTL